VQLDIYLQETAHHAARLEAMLADAKARLRASGVLTPLETGGALHAIQVLVENAIGKAKQLVKSVRGVTPVDAYSAFEDLVALGMLDAGQLGEWRQAIGMRNRIVHDYLNIDTQILFALLQDDAYRFVVDFLKRLEWPVSR
jgi:uncharacterized protein YutE (UPF0331/DUF86 family)